MLRRLLVKKYEIKEVELGNKIKISREKFTIDKKIIKKYKDFESCIEDVRLRIVKPGEYDIFVNSNLDFQPIACKEI